jgi:integrase
MACVTKRKGKWIVDYRLGSKRYVPSFGSKSEAESFLRQLRLRPIDQLTGYFPIELKTLGSAILDYLNAVTPQKALRTHEVDKLALKDLNSEFKNVLVSEISCREIEFYQSSLKSKLQPATVNRRFNVIRNFFKKCLEWNYTSTDPTRGLKRLPEPPVDRSILSADEIKSILQSLPDWAKDPFMLIAHTSVRRSEAITLKWDQVDFSKREISFYSLKGGVHRRKVIPMTSALNELLLKKWNQQSARRTNSKLVFLNEHLLPIKPVTFSSAVCKLGRRSGVKNAGIQILRRTLLTEMSENNQSGSVIQRVAGHSSLITTQKYLHHSNDVLRSALESVQKRRLDNVSEIKLAEN